MIREGFSLSEKRTKNAKKKKISNNRELKNLKSNLNPSKDTSNQNDSSNQTSLLKNELIILEKSFIERAEFDFYLKLESQGFQNAKKIPELLNSMIKDPNLLNSFGEALRRKSINYQKSLLLSKVNNNGDINLVKDVRNISYNIFQDTSE